MRRLVNFMVRMDLMERTQTIKKRERSKKTIKKNSKFFKINNLNKNIILNRTL